VVTGAQHTTQNEEQTTFGDTKRTFQHDEIQELKMTSYSGITQHKETKKRLHVRSALHKQTPQHLAASPRNVKVRQFRFQDTRCVLALLLCLKISRSEKGDSIED